MSERKRKASKSGQKVVQEPTQQTTAPVTPPPITPEVQDLMTSLVEKCTALVYDLVDCECERRKDCAVFVTAREIARVLKRLTKVVPRRVTPASVT